MNKGDKFKIGKQNGQLGMNKVHVPKSKPINTKNPKYNWPFEDPDVKKNKNRNRVH